LKNPPFETINPAFLYKFPSVPVMSGRFFLYL
jgi:hypothetical protein